jgi:tetratricopeptide (TPR) repeat protein
MKKNIKLWSTFFSSSILLGCVSSPQLSSTASDKLAIADRPAAAQKAYERGKQHHLQIQIDLAEEHYLRALALDPTHLGAQHAMAIIQANRGDLNRAIALLISLANTHPDKASIFANLGHAYFLKGDFKLAQEALDHATMLDPENMVAWNELELVLAEIKRSNPLPIAAIIDAPAIQSGVRADITELASGLYKLDYSGSATTAAASVSSPSSSSASIEITTPPSVLPVELVNGNGVPGLLRELKTLLPENTWKVMRMSNHKQFDLKTTRIEYHESDYASAQRLADHMGVHAVLAPNYRAGTSGLRVILGHDFRNVSTLRKRLVCTFSNQTS